jgi:hypothetical protein
MLEASRGLSSVSHRKVRAAADYSEGFWRTQGKTAKYAGKTRLFLVRWRKHLKNAGFSTSRGPRGGIVPFTPLLNAYADLERIR